MTDSAHPTLQALRADLDSGAKAPLARVLARLETAPDAPETLELLDAAYAAPRARVLGITGPPGVGKSTLIGALIRSDRADGLTVGVIAVDPSSRRSGGALLGDRVRLQTDPEDGGVFVRSMAARDRLGGLAGLTVAAMVLMRALFDRVIIETVGVGQSETDVAGAADTVLFCVQPGSGDALQFMKAGIVEIPDVIAVTKADLGKPATRAIADVRAALDAADGPGSSARWEVPVLAVSATSGAGLEALRAALDSHAGWLDSDGRRSRRRQDQAEGWLEDVVRERWGREGLARARAGADRLTFDGSPFSALADVVSALGV